MLPSGVEHQRRDDAILFGHHPSHLRAIAKALVDNGQMVRMGEGMDVVYALVPLSAANGLPMAGQKTTRCGASAWRLGSGSKIARAVNFGGSRVSGRLCRFSRS